MGTADDAATANATAANAAAATTTNATAAATTNATANAAAGSSTDATVPATTDATADATVPATTATTVGGTAACAAKSRLRWIPLKIYGIFTVFGDNVRRSIGILWWSSVGCFSRSSRSKNFHRLFFH